MGRSRSLQLTLPRPEVSAEHAVLAWDGEVWSVRDLGSRNGTHLNGERLAPGVSQPLGLGDVVAFGAAEGGFTVTSVDAPAPTAVCGDEVVSGLGTWLSLPDTGDDAVMITADDHLGWVVLDGDEARPVHSGLSIEAGGRSWRLDLPEALAATREHRAVVDDVALHFRVSADEEHVEPTVVVGGVARPLRPRAHHYPLLTLARLRLEDVEAGLPEPEQGWVDAERFRTMLRMSANHVHVALYRCRKDLAELGVRHARDLVEIRATARTLRLGLRHVVVAPLS
ncbi:MAG: FHA domain-containing protein [Alphaproteobacteria bacterium]|nr:FHA domain-containing protein [Alphaproteobacteria bacterium]